MLTTGVSTFIKVKDTSGFKSNDFISVDGETLLITGVSSQRSGFYVNRVNNTGIHTIGDGLVALSYQIDSHSKSLVRLMIILLRIQQHSLIQKKL